MDFTNEYDKELIGILYTTEELEQMIIEDILANTHTHGHDIDLDKKVEAAYKEVAGVDFVEALERRKRIPAILYGPPGEGKTSVVYAAAKAAAQLLGMNFVEVEQGVHDVGPRDLCFIKVEMAGQSSAIGFTGIPAKSEGEEPGMRILPPETFLLSKKAGASVWLLDDMSAASQKLLPALLGILTDRKYGTHALGEHATILGTANLGASLDGTIGISQLGTAIATRVKNFYVRDTVEAFCQRFEKWIGDIGGDDCGFIAFLKRNHDIFGKNERMQKSSTAQTLFTKNIAPFPNSRSIMNFAMEMLRMGQKVRADMGSSELKNKHLRNISRLAQAICGVEFANRVVNFYMDYFDGIEHAVGEFLSASEDGYVDAREKFLNYIKLNYKDGLAAEEQDFAYRLFSCMSSSIARVVMNSLKEHQDPHSKDVNSDTVRVLAYYMSRFADAAQGITNATHWLPAVQNFKDRIVNQASDRYPALFNPTVSMAGKKIFHMDYNLAYAILKPMDLRSKFKRYVAEVAAIMSGYVNFADELGYEKGAHHVQDGVGDEVPSSSKKRRSPRCKTPAH
jgi:hypothetical protein